MDEGEKIPIRVLGLFPDAANGLETRLKRTSVTSNADGRIPKRMETITLR